MEDEPVMRLVYILNEGQGFNELRTLANTVKQRNGWILALYHDRITCGVREEYVKAFYLDKISFASKTNAVRSRNQAPKS